MLRVTVATSATLWWHLFSNPSAAKSPLSTLFTTVRFPCSRNPKNANKKQILNAFPGNHTGYKQWKGRKTTTEEILELYEGLQQSFLNDFSILISGYIPSAEGVQAVGKIGRDLKRRASTKSGSFFWGISKSLLLPFRHTLTGHGSIGPSNG